MKKIILIPIMMLVLVISVMAYDVNSTLRINGEYRESGVLTSAVAGLTITNPNSVVLLDNQTMNDTSTGLFYYDYVLPSLDGEYTADIVFYKSGVSSGSDSQTFDVGDVSVLRWSTCPQGDARTLLYFIIGALIVVGLVGAFSKIPSLLVVSGILLVFMTLIVANCGAFLYLITIFLGLVYLLIGLSIRT